jgi:hypothetical protein
MDILVITPCEFYMFGCLLLGQWWKQTKTVFGEFTNQIAHTHSDMSVYFCPHEIIGHIFKTFDNQYFTLLKFAATLQFLLKLAKNKTPDMTVYVHSWLMQLLTLSWFSSVLVTTLPMVILKCQKFSHSSEIF